MKKILKQDVLPHVWEILRRRYGRLALLTGQGITKGERVQFQLDGKDVRCAIKTSTGGRISFGKRDGKWSGLDDSDFVVIVAPTALHHDDYEVSMYDQQTMRDVFDRNQTAQEMAGMGELPNWVAPFHEEGRGPRGVADGFADKALWAEPLSTQSAALVNASEAPQTPTVRALTIDEAKLGLAMTYSVSPEAIEISIRW
jgi:hypothetical protein